MLPHRPCFFSALAVLLVTSGPNPAQPPAKKEKPFDQRDLSMTLQRAELYLDTPKFELATKDEPVPLEVKYATNLLKKGVLLTHRSYNGGLVGPVIRVRPGQTLEIDLKNSLPPDSDTVHDPNVPHELNTTNLHTHGLHVSPKGESDNVFLYLRPGSRFRYKFEIPTDHPPGTYWYHAHRHGSVSVQLSSGMAGALIVEGGLDDAPELRGVREQVLVFQQFTYRHGSDGVSATVEPDDIFRTPDPRSDTETAVNGQVTPMFVFRPGEIQRWRMIHAGIKTSLPLKLVRAIPDPGNRDREYDLYEIALDGITTGEMTRKRRIEFQPGYRSDVLIQAPSEPGDYLLITEENDPTRALRKKTTERRHLVKIRVEGRSVDMKLPAPGSLAKYRPASLKPIEPNEITLKRQQPFVFKNYLGKFTVNDEAFDPHDMGQLSIPLDAVEEWTIESIGDGHPFHMHVNPFQVEIVDPETGQKRWVWKDTLFVRGGSQTTIRTRFTRFTGRTVMHCHILDHEDQGMMKVFTIAPKDASDSRGRALLPGQGAALLPNPVPAWKLRDAFGKEFRSDDYRGKPVLLVLHLGLGCPHCSRQMIALGKKEAEFEKLGVSVVSISAKGIDKDVVERYRKEYGLQIPVLLDPSLSVFRAMKCLKQEREPLHATFLLDARGELRWQSVGDEPEMDLDLVSEQIKKLSSNRSH